MTSELAKRLAKDLEEVGNKFGFISTREEPVQEQSKYRIDVFWALEMPESSPFPIINIASIEIQYSTSPSSISHNIFKVEKTKHPAIHVVISYDPITQDYREILEGHYPHSGLVIIDGKENVRSLNVWITRFVALEEVETELSISGEELREIIFSQLDNGDEDYVIQQVKTSFQSKIEEIVLPSEVTSLLNSLLEMESNKDSFNRGIFDSVYYSFIEFIQEKMRKYNISSIELPVELFFSELTVLPEFHDHDVDFDNYVRIIQDKIIIRERGYPLEVDISNGNIYIESPVGTVYEESWRYEDLVYFIQCASEIVRDEVTKYNITDQEKNILEALIDTFS